MSRGSHRRVVWATDPSVDRAMAAPSELCLLIGGAQEAGLSWVTTGGRAHPCLVERGLARVVR